MPSVGPAAQRGVGTRHPRGDRQRRRDRGARVRGAPARARKSRRESSVASSLGPTGRVRQSPVRPRGQGTGASPRMRRYVPAGVTATGPNRGAWWWSCPRWRRPRRAAQASPTVVGPYDGAIPFQLRAPERRHRHRLPRPRRRPVLRRVRQDEPERHRLRHRRLHRPGAGPGRRRGQQVLLLPARPLDRLGRPGPGAGALALGRQLLLRPRPRGRRRQRPQLPDRRHAADAPALRARRLPALLRRERRRRRRGAARVGSRPDRASRRSTRRRSATASTATAASYPECIEPGGEARTGGGSAGRGSG